MLIRELFSNSLVEMPMYHPSLSNHALNSANGNRQYFKRFIDVVEPIEQITDNIILYNGDFKTGGCYIAADPTLEKIYYMMNYKQDSNSVLGRFVYQHFLWIDKSARSVVGHLPNQYFFSLVDDYFTIATDSEQTTDGQHFWERRIRDAFDRNLNVYYYDNSSDYIEELSNANEVHLFNEKYHIYSEDEGSLDRVFVISSTQLITPQVAVELHGSESNAVSSSSRVAPANNAKV